MITKYNKERLTITLVILRIFVCAICVVKCTCNWIFKKKEYIIEGLQIILFYKNDKIKLHKNESTK